MAGSVSYIDFHASVDVVVLVGVQEDRKECVWVLFAERVFGVGDRLLPAAF